MYHMTIRKTIFNAAMALAILDLVLQYIGTKSVRQAEASSMTNVI